MTTSNVSPTTSTVKAEGAQSIFDRARQVVNDRRGRYWPEGHREMIYECRREGIIDPVFVRAFLERENKSSYISIRFYVNLRQMTEGFTAGMDENDRLQPFLLATEASYQEFIKRVLVQINRGISLEIQDQRNRARSADEAEMGLWVIVPERQRDAGDQHLPIVGDEVGLVGQGQPMTTAGQVGAGDQYSLDQSGISIQPLGQVHLVIDQKGTVQYRILTPTYENPTKKGGDGYSVLIRGRRIEAESAEQMAEIIKRVHPLAAGPIKQFEQALATAIAETTAAGEVV